MVLLLLLQALLLQMLLLLLLQMLLLLLLLLQVFLLSQEVVVVMLLEVVLLLVLKLQVQSLSLLLPEDGRVSGGLGSVGGLGDWGTGRFRGVRGSGRRGDWDRRRGQGAEEERVGSGRVGGLGGTRGIRWDVLSPRMERRLR